MQLLLYKSSTTSLTVRRNPDRRIDMLCLTVSSDLGRLRSDGFNVVDRSHARAADVDNLSVNYSGNVVIAATAQLIWFCR